MELWSVKEGEQQFNEHNDLLFNYLRFWQASEESKKTSMRVTEKHKQMVEDGDFRGGKPPYGYKLEKSGKINKKSKEFFKLAIDESTSLIVKLIYNFVHDEGYGSNRITKYLNDNGIPSYTGGKWNTGAINFILRNPIYKGYMTYGKRLADEDLYKTQSRENWIYSRESNNEIAIIDPKIWDKVQTIRSSRSPEKVKNNDAERLTVTRSPLLFVGSIKCGHCGSPLTTTYNTKTHKLKDGTVKKYTQPKYRCSGKALGKTECDGQTIYAQNKIETTVLDEIDKYLDKLKRVDFTNEIEKFRKSNVDDDEKLLRKLQKDIETKYSEVSTLTGEVTKSILGQSSFKPELLSSLIDKKEQEIKESNSAIETLQKKISSKKLDVNEMESLQNYIPIWKNIFSNSTPEKRKMMLSYIVDNIIVYKDNIDLKVKLNINQFISSVDKGQYLRLTGTPS